MRNRTYVILIILFSSFCLEGYCLAFFSSGKIDSRFSYTDLKVRGSYLEGKIINHTEHLKEDVLIRFYAYNVFKKCIWRVSVSISVIGASSSKTFSTYISSDTGNPHNFRVKVIRPKRTRRPKKSSVKVSAESTVSSSGGIHLRVRGSEIKIWGEGQQVSETFTLDKGLSVFEFEHRGDGHFSIWLMDEEGKEDLIANDVGRFSGSKGVIVEKKGLYFVNVKADLDAKWSIIIERSDKSQRSKTKRDEKSGPNQKKIRAWKDENGMWHFSNTQALE